MEKSNTIEKGFYIHFFCSRKRNETKKNAPSPEAFLLRKTTRKTSRFKKLNSEAFAPYAAEK